MNDEIKLDMLLNRPFAVIFNFFQFHWWNIFLFTFLVQRVIRLSNLLNERCMQDRQCFTNSITLSQEHHKGEKGHKGHKYHDKGSYKKGHSTKGKHIVHKLDEYKKNKHFHDEDYDEGHHKKHGGYHHHHDEHHGGKYKKGHKKSGYHEDHKGKKGHHKKGDHYHEHKGHKKAGGHDEHYGHKSDYGKKGGHKDHKKWEWSKKH